MNEHHETPTHYFSEKTDSNRNSTTAALNSHLDVLATTVSNPAVCRCASIQPPIFRYDNDTSTRILAMATTKDDEHSLPFLQRIQLTGPGDYIVRATGQVDDGAMRNCISKKRWEHYGHCLTPLEPSKTRIKVANGSRIAPLGCWTGTVKVGKVGAPSSFEIFDCGDAFDVILGKPWLKAVKAKHDYSTDEITISHNGENDIIRNSATDPTVDHTQISVEYVDETPPETPTSPTEDALVESDPTEQLDREWARIHQIKTSESPWKETRWAQHLDIDPMDTDEDDTQPTITTEDDTETVTLSTKERRRLDAETLHQRRDEEGEILLTLAIAEADAIRKEERRARRNAKSRERKARKSQPTLANPIADHIHLFEKSEQRIKDLHSKLKHLRAINEPDTLDIPSTNSDTNDTIDAEIHKLGDIHQEPFKIDQGTNESRRVLDPFNKERVEEIVSKIEFGTDLTEDQLQRVKSLVRKFADVFALSMSEVLSVDWHHHHLDIDPDTKLPKRMSQRPITEKQKDWYYRMLDEMEESHVIQKVPGEFIKCLNSTNLAPKEAGKTGATRVEIL